MLKPIKNLHIRWYVCIFVKNKQKVHVIILDKKFVENIKDVIMNAEFNGIFIYPRHPLHILLKDFVDELLLDRFLSNNRGI